MRCSAGSKRGYVRITKVSYNPKGITYKLQSSTQPPEHPNWAYELIGHLFKCLNIPPIVCCQNPSHYQQNLVEVRNDGCSQQNQINLRKENRIRSCSMVSCLPIHIIPRSIWYHGSIAHRPAKPIFEWKLRVSGNECIVTFCTLGYCLVLKTGTK